jgi:VanZ family protein
MTSPPDAIAWAASPGALRLWRGSLAALMLAICILAFDPNPPEALDTGWDKLNHGLAFAVLAPCAALALQGLHWRWPAAALLALAFGAFIELVQSQIPGRSGEWQDLLADAAGIALGRLAGQLLERKLELR